MRSSKICTVDHCLGDQMEEKEMGRARGMYGEKENYTQIFGWPT